MLGHEREKTVTPERNWIQEALIATLLFGLLLEWLRPLTYVSDVMDMDLLQPIWIAILAFLLLDFIRCPVFVSWPLKLIISIGITIHYVGDYAWWEFLGWLHYFETWDADATRIVEGEWTAFSKENRALLFLIGWSMMVYALYMLLVYRQMARWFVIATLLYVTLVHEILGGDETYTVLALLRTAGFGLLLLAVVRLPKLSRQYKSPLDMNFFSWGLYSVTLVALLLGGSWLGSMLHDQHGSGGADWQQFQVVQWIQDRWNQWFSPAQATVAKTGYGHDDMQLGRPVEEDHTIAFTAITGKLGYWRGETKSIYTGQGWMEADGKRSNMVMREELDQSEHPDKTWFEQEVRFEVSSLGNVLFASGDIIAVDFIEGQDGVPLTAEDVQIDQSSAKVSMRNEAQAVNYKVVVEEQGNAGKALSEQEWQMYTQLPDDFPQSVKQLAEFVVNGSSTGEDKARDIAAYLSTMYAYDLNTEVPPKGEDFVEHFLFKSKAGYCDHFSTAMVVMLRAIGIPSRWAKGYASGQITQYHMVDGQPQWEVTVRQSDAHSWAEVYVPDKGWTLFEPTPGFAEDAMSQDIAKMTDNQQISPFAGPLSVIGMRMLEEFSQVDQEDLIQRFNEMRTIWNKFWARYHDTMLTWGYVASLVVIVSLGIWGIVYFLQRVRSGQQLLKQDALSWYWNQVFRKYGRKRPEQTLREYAASLPLDGHRARAMEQLITIYEQSVFGGERLTRSMKVQIRQLWHQMNRRTKKE